MIHFEYPTNPSTITPKTITVNTIPIMFTEFVVHPWKEEQIIVTP